MGESEVILYQNITIIKLTKSIRLTFDNDYRNMSDGINFYS